MIKSIEEELDHPFRWSNEIRTFFRILLHNIIPYYFHIEPNLNMQNLPDIPCQHRHSSRVLSQCTKISSMETYASGHSVTEKQIF